MDRDYDIGRFTTNSFYGNIMSKEELADILTYFNIRVFDADGSQRKTADLIRDLQELSRRTGSISTTRRIGDAMQSLVYSLTAEFEMFEPDDTTGEELDVFLGSFKIKKQYGGVV